MVVNGIVGYAQVRPKMVGSVSDFKNRILDRSPLRGHLEVLKWARDNGCDWNERTCASAALRGHLEVLKWAQENGCKWDNHTC